MRGYGHCLFGRHTVASTRTTNARLDENRYETLAHCLLAVIVGPINHTTFLVQQLPQRLR